MIATGKTFVERFDITINIKFSHKILHFSREFSLQALYYAGPETVTLMSVVFLFEGGNYVDFSTNFNLKFHFYREKKKFPDFYFSYAILNRCDLGQLWAANRLAQVIYRIWSNETENGTSSDFGSIIIIC